METKFQTSFIPKKPLSTSSVAPRRSSTSGFMLIAIVLFVLSLGGAGFVVAWQRYLLQVREVAKNTLVKNQQQFNPALIDTLKKTDTKISLAKTLIERHLAVSGIFDIISRLTAENIRFSSFEFSAPTSGDAKDGIKVTLHGVGTSFSAIAFQSSVFGRSSEYGTNKIIKNPILSDLSLEPNGSVEFTFTSTINPADISYANPLRSVTNGNNK